MWNTFQEMFQTVFLYSHLYIISENPKNLNDREDKWNSSFVISSLSLEKIINVSWQYHREVGMN